MTAPVVLLPPEALEVRREAVRRSASALNGIDFVEVDLTDRRRLTVSWLKPLAAPVPLAGWNIAGGTRLTGLRVVGAAPVDARTTQVTLSMAGDRSPYTLVADMAGAEIDPLLARQVFRFFPDCEAAVDCRVAPSAPLPMAEEAIDYTARDYPALRQMLLDRLSRQVPGWSERNPADAMVTLAELLAYVGDRLAWQQDAVTTEAALATARLRASVRRHGRLMDYTMREGATARTWVRIRLADGAGPVELPAGTRLFTRIADAPVRLPVGWPDLAAALTAGVQPFLLPLPSGPLHAAHDAMRLHGWGAPRSMLAAGATDAVLRGAFPALAPGMALVLAEARGPLTGDPADADPRHRHAVRLTTVEPLTDPLGGLPLTRIGWSAEDALPFPLAIAARTTDGRNVPDVAVAWGNVVLAEHGRVVEAPHGSGALVPDTVPDAGAPGRWRPRLGAGPLAWVAPVSGTSAARQGAVDAAVAMPALTLRFRPDGAPAQDWEAAPDLLGGDPARFVVEPDGTGGAALLFGTGDGAPPAGATADARLRIGGGRSGNVAAGTILHIETDMTDVIGVTNPLPGQGGAEPESMAAARRRIPEAWKRRGRAIVAADYAAAAGEVAGVQRAVARRRWNGAWPVMQVAVDPLGGVLDAELANAVRATLAAERLAGHGTAIITARPVAIELALKLCLLPGHLAGDIRRAAETLLSAGIMPDGRPGLFHPDRIIMGEAFALSPIIAALQALAGVSHVTATRFERAEAPGPQGLVQGRLIAAPGEMFVLANDPDFPDRGRCTLEVVAAQ